MLSVSRSLVVQPNPKKYLTIEGASGSTELGSNYWYVGILRGSEIEYAATEIFPGLDGFDSKKMALAVRLFAFEDQEEVAFWWTQRSRRRGGSYAF